MLFKEEFKINNEHFRGGTLVMIFIDEGNINERLQDFRYYGCFEAVDQETINKKEKFSLIT